jgi:hypothetical protein
MLDAPVPPPARSAGLDGDVVPIDLHRLEATVRFDPAARHAEVRAQLEFRVDGPTGRPAFDLRQPIGEARLDGQSLSPDAMVHHDLGAGEASRMRVLDVVLDAGTWHRLDLRYDLTTPEATGAQPLEWTEGGVAWDLWMSDLEPGRYLEMWLPVGLCHDRFALELGLEVAGGRPHVLTCNGAAEATGPAAWTVRFPPHFTSLSPMIVLAPAEDWEQHRLRTELAGRPLEVVAGKPKGLDIDTEDVARDTAAWLCLLAQRYGPWVHGTRFDAVMWASTRGMEYDGATTAHPDALEHEVFHSWFGRGIKPAHASDGWIDEAVTTWATTTRRAGAVDRFAALPLGLDEPAVVLAPSHPWSRFTPREAYVQGARLMAGMADLVGGAARFRSVLAAWYQGHAGGFVTTEGLREHLGRATGADLGPWWDRYVYGREG